MASHIARRTFLATLVGGAAATWPLTARAQQPALPVIGFLNGLGQNDRPNLPAAFRRGLGEAGYVDGRNVAIEYRFAENRLDRLPALAADLVSRKVNVIAATGGGAPVMAAMTATKNIPIVFTTAGDPVQMGYVASLNRPGGNVTGVSWFSSLVAGKGLGLLHELVPNAALIGLLANPKLPEAERTRYDAHGLRAPSVSSCSLSMPARRARSMPLSPPCVSVAPTRSLSVLIRSLPAGSSKS
jgi:putative ABC transport system substrate-binding protein